MVWLDRSSTRSSWMNGNGDLTGDPGPQAAVDLSIRLSDQVLVSHPYRGASEQRQEVEQAVIGEPSGRHPGLVIDRCAIPGDTRLLRLASSTSTQPPDCREPDAWDTEVDAIDPPDEERGRGVLRGIHDNFRPGNAPHALIQASRDLAIAFRRRLSLAPTGPTICGMFRCRSTSARSSATWARSTRSHPPNASFPTATQNVQSTKRSPHPQRSSSERIQRYDSSPTAQNPGS